MLLIHLKLNDSITIIYASITIFPDIGLSIYDKYLDLFKKITSAYLCIKSVTNFSN